MRKPLSLTRLLCAGVLALGGLGTAQAQLTSNTCYEVDNTTAGGIISLNPPPSDGASSPLNCSANDISYSDVQFQPLDSCVNELDTVTFTITGDASATANGRFDVGYWINAKAGDAELDPGTVGDECEVMYLDANNSNPYIPGGNSCGDIPQQPASTNITFDKLTVSCAPSTAAACQTTNGSNVSFHTLTVYENNGNSACTGLADALTPGTTSKCIKTGCTQTPTTIPNLTLTKTCAEADTNTYYNITGDDKILYPGDKLNCTLIVENDQFLDNGVTPAAAATDLYVYDFFPDIFGIATGGSVGSFTASQGTVDGPNTTNAYEGNTFKKKDSFLWSIGTLGPGSTAILSFVMTNTPIAICPPGGTCTTAFACNSAKLAIDNPGPAPDPATPDTTATILGPDGKINLWLDYPAPALPGSNDPVAGRGVVGELQAETVEVGGCRITRAAISAFGVSDAGGVNAIRWSTSSEEGTLGFHVERLDPVSGEYVRLNSQLLPANIAAPQGSEYQFDDDSPVAGAGTYRLIEVESLGRTLVHGPFEIDESGSANMPGVMQEAAEITTEDGKFKASGHQPRLKMQQRLDKFKQQKQHPGNKGNKDRKNSSLQQQEQDADSSVAQLLRRGIESVVDFLIPSAHAAAAMKVETDASGIYALSAGQIADTLGEQLDSIEQRIAAGEVRITRRGKEIDWHGDNGGVLFFAEELSPEESLYAKHNVYWVTLEPGSLAAEVNGNARKANSSSFREALDVEVDELPMIQFPFEDGDFWYWGYLTGSADAEATFGSPGATGSGDVSLTVRLHGTGATDDNRVDLLVNGTSVGTAAWQGKSEQAVTVSFDASLLQADGMNTLTLSAAEEAAFSFVLFDGLTLEYDRHYVADDDMLRFRADGNRAVSLSGFSDGGISIYDISDPAATVRLSGLNPKYDRKAKSWSVKVETRPDGEYLAYAGAAGAPVAVSPFDPQGVVTSAQSADYLVITSADLVDGANAIAQYRQNKGHETAVVTYEQIVDELQDGIPTPQAVREFLKQTWSITNGKTKYALLAGAGNYDYRDLLPGTAGTNLVPPLLVRNVYGVFGADMLSGDVEGDDSIPEIAVGRIPAFTSEELNSYLQKVIKSEEQHDGLAERALWIADDSEEFGLFDYNSDLATADAPRSMEHIKAYLGNPHTAAEINALMSSEINAGVDLAYYLGHGAADHLATERIYDVDDVDMLTNSQLPVFVGLTCSITRFDIPGFDSLGSALMMKDNGGASAVWGATSLSSNGWATGVGQEFLRAVFRQNLNTVGEAVIAAMRAQGADTGVLGSHRFSQILGDPAATVR